MNQRRFKELKMNGLFATVILLFGTVLKVSAQTGAVIDACYTASGVTLTRTVNASGFSGNPVLQQWQVLDSENGFWVNTGNSGITYAVTVTSPKYYRLLSYKGLLGDPTEEAYSNVVYLDKPMIGAVEKKFFENQGNGTIGLQYHEGSVVQWEMKQGAGPWVNKGFAGQTQFPIDTLTRTTQLRVVLQDCGSNHYSRIGEVTIETRNFSGRISGTNQIYSGGSVSLTLSSYQGSILRWEKLEGTTTTTISGTSATLSQSGITSVTYYRAVVSWQGVTENSPWWRVSVVADSPSPTLVENTYTALDVPVAPSKGIFFDGTNSIRTVTFQDGLGRPVQQVVKAATGSSSKDIVTFADYDANGLATRRYLPYASTTTGWSNSHTNLQSAQAAFFDGSTQGVTANTQPWADVKLDDSPLAPTEKVGAPGAAWDADGAQAKELAYHFNTSGDGVRLWDTDGMSQDEYAPGTLVKTTIIDENDNRVIIFKDKAGREVCRRVEHELNTWLETYYVYDDYGRIRFIVPPEAMDRAMELGTEDFELLKKDTTISSHTGASYVIKQGAKVNLADGFNVSEGKFFAKYGNGALDLPDINYFVYEFRYDNKGRLIEKKVPGSDWESIVYDRRDRPVLSQNAILKASNQWMFVKYDAQDRPVYSGVYASSATRSSLQTSADQTSVKTAERRQGSTTHGYSNVAFPTTGLTVQQVYYYDDYDFDRDGSADYTFITGDLPGQDTVTIASVNKLATGSKTLILDGGSDWLINVMFYDRKGRPVQALSNNHSHLAVSDVTTAIYNDFTGTVQKLKTTTRIASDTYSVIYRYEYDRLDRVSHVHQQNATDPEVEVAAYTYNDLGQLITKKLHLAQGETGYLQEIDYSYNERGWLKQVNDPAVLTDPKKFFALRLNYNTTTSGLTGAASYNGNISGMEWSQYGGRKEAYGFTYDKADRLQESDYGAGSGYTTDADAYNEDFTWDHNGNMTNASRTSVDNLTATLAGNQVTRVEDSTGSNAGFSNGASEANELAYNTAGYLIKDLNKNIASITYNHLSKPTTITFGDGKTVNYTYAANGMKLKRELKNGSTTLETVKYVSNYYVVNEVVKHFSSPEGRTVVKTTSNTGAENQYYLTDHLSNIRTVFTSAAPSVWTNGATMETENATTEDNYWFNITRVPNPGANTTPGGNEAQTLDANSRSGAGTIIEVFPGDNVSISVQTYYTTSGSVTNGAAVVLADIANAIFTGTGGFAGDGFNSSTTIPGGYGTGAILADKTPDSNPKAYVNYLFFDRNFNYVNAGYNQVDGSGSRTLTLNTATFDQPGYLFMYLTYEATSGYPVSFDDFSYTHNTTRVLASNSYYPFGMLSGQSWVRPENPMNRQLFNAGNERNEVTGFDETFYRLYDPALGRFMGVDPLAAAYGNKSPYHYAGNNPLKYNDPMGDRPVLSGREGELYAYTMPDGTIDLIQAGGHNTGLNWGGADADLFNLFHGFGFSYADLGLMGPWGPNYSKKARTQELANMIGAAWRAAGTHGGSGGVQFNSVQQAADFVVSSMRLSKPQLIAFGNKLASLTGGSDATTDVNADGSISTFAFYGNALYSNYDNYAGGIVGDFSSYGGGQNGGSWVDRFTDGFSNGSVTNPLAFSNITGGIGVVVGISEIAVKADARYTPKYERRFTHLRETAKATKYVKNIGATLGGISVGATIVESALDGQITYGDSFKVVNGAVMIGVPEYGLVFGLVDLVTLISSQTSLTDRIANGIDSAAGENSVIFSFK